MKADPRDPGVEPPQRARARPSARGRRAAAARRARAPTSDVLDQVGDEELERHAVEAEALLDDEGAVERRAAGRCSALDEEDAAAAAPCRASSEPGSNARAQSVDEPLQAAAEREHEQHAAPISDVEHAEARLGDGVVGGLLVRGERDRVGEASRGTASRCARTWRIWRSASQSARGGRARASAARKSQVRRWACMT